MKFRSWIIPLVAVLPIASACLAAEPVPAPSPIAPMVRFSVPIGDGNQTSAAFVVYHQGQYVLVIGSELGMYTLVPLGGPPGPGPNPPGPNPPGPSPSSVEKVALDAAMALPDDAKRAGEASVLAGIFELVAGRIDRKEITNAEQLRLSIQQQRLSVFTTDRLAYWSPWDKAWGSWVNGEIKAGRLKVEDMAGFKAICTATATGLRKVVK